MKTGVRSDGMQVDDTPDRIYIHNLDEEIASIEAEKEQQRLIFLPDIEKKLGKLPKHVLQMSEPPPQPQGHELVLYSVPTSLSVPVEHDSVRKAIIESRARARQEQEKVSSHDAMLHDDSQEESSMSRYTNDGHEAGEDADPDAMDLG